MCTHTHTHTHFLTHIAAYEPPPDILFIPPVEKATLSRKNNQFFSTYHDISINVSPEYWLTRAQHSDLGVYHSLDLTVELCVAASMHLKQPFLSEYTIVSPIYFISCQSVKPCRVTITFPHAAEFNKEMLQILSMTPINPNLLSSGDRIVSELNTDASVDDLHRIQFCTSLSNPSLYAVAVKKRSEEYPPLRCTLFVSYPDLQQTASVSGLYITTYMGMDLKTVHTVRVHLCMVSSVCAWVEVDIYFIFFNRSQGFYFS